MRVLAIDIGGTKTSIALVDRTSITHQHTWASPAHADDLQIEIVKRGHELQEHASFDACGIGFGGQFDFAQQHAIRSVHVPGWEQFPISSWAEQSFGLPTITDNDANVAGLGEATWGAGENATHAVYLTISTGIGGSIITNGHIQRGSHSLAGEFGHLTLDPQGPECGCGLRGCAERILSGLWLQHDHGKPAEALMQDANFRSDYAMNLAALLQQITMVLDPEVFILGGGIGASSDDLARATQHALSERLSNWERPTPKVRRAAFAGNSVLIGAGELAKERYGTT